MSVQTKGPIHVYGHAITDVKAALLDEGFTDPTPLQVWKPGQVFGLTKSIDDKLEMHVRGYDDDSLDSEVELSREYLEHPYNSRPYFGPLIEILSRHGIPFNATRPLPHDPGAVSVPERLTPWKPLAVLAGLALGGAALWWFLKNPKDDEPL
jgi:hypothetical protein